MSYIGIIVNAIFATNALFGYGLEAGFPLARRVGHPLAVALLLALMNAAAAALLWCLRVFLLVPLGFPRLDILFFVIIVLPLLDTLTSLLPAVARKKSCGAKTLVGELNVSSLVFGIALITARSEYGLIEAAVAAGASGLGYIIATVVLDGIRERLELSDTPKAMRGLPSLLLSAGLVSMALMGIDAAFLRGFGG